MTVFVVDTLSDNPDDGFTLREALARADDEAASPGDDTIAFAATVQGGQIILTGGQLTVSSDVTIDGGTNVTINAAGTGRVLLVQGDGSEVSLNNLTITGGYLNETRPGDGLVGAGIRTVAGTTLSLTGTTVTDNRAYGTYSGGAGIYALGPVTLDGSTISRNHAGGGPFDGDAGGIYARSILTVSHSTISGNTAYLGGGITIGLSATATVTSSTISGNRAGRGGGILAEAHSELTVADSTLAGNYASVQGGGILVSPGAGLTATNSTLAGNRAGQVGGGLDAFAGSDVTLASSTISGNYASYGGGLALLAISSFTVANSIVAGNSAGSDPDVTGLADQTTSNGHNIFGSNVTVSAGGDIEGVSAGTLFASIDPSTGGGQLAANGGPTQTIALRDIASNPALAGSDPGDTPATDQRGEVRPQPAGTDPDVGAFELDQTLGQFNEIVGTAGDDFLRGTSGRDLIRGRAGDDRLWGRPDDDVLMGDAGADVLAGKGGLDQMIGGKGADRFLLRDVDDAPATGPDHDEVLDFRRGQGDKLDLSPIDADRTMTGNQAFHFVGDCDFFGPGQLRYQATADGDFLVSGNIDTDPTADFAFVVRSHLTHLRASDFLL